MKRPNNWQRANTNHVSRDGYVVRHPGFKRISSITLKQSQDRLSSHSGDCFIDTFTLRIVEVLVAMIGKPEAARDAESVVLFFAGQHETCRRLETFDNRFAEEGATKS